MTSGPDDKVGTLLQHIASTLGVVADDLYDPSSELLRRQDQQRDLLEAFDRLQDPEAREACLAYVRMLLRDQA